MTPRELGIPQDVLIIGGKVYKLECEDQLTDADGEHCLGMTSVVKQIIRLSAGSGLHTLKDTLLHEALHAMDYNAGTKLTEEQVHVLAGAILDFLWSNAGVAYWLAQQNAAVAKELPPKAKKKPSKKRAVPKNTKVKKVKNPVGFGINPAPSSEQLVRQAQQEKKEEVPSQHQSLPESGSFDPPEPS